MPGNTVIVMIRWLLFIIASAQGAGDPGNPLICPARSSSLAESICTPPQKTKQVPERSGTAVRFVSSANLVASPGKGKQPFGCFAEIAQTGLSIPF